MKDKLIKLLEDEFKYPVLLQGSLGPDDAYPPSFFTIWNSATPDHSNYDNTTIDWAWYFDVNFYSTDPALVNTVLWQAAEHLKGNGFILLTGKGYDLMSDEITHTGRGISVAIIERNEVEEDAE